MGKSVNRSHCVAKTYVNFCSRGSSKIFWVASRSGIRVGFHFSLCCRRSSTGLLQPQLVAHAVLVLAGARFDHFSSVVRAPEREWREYVPTRTWKTSRDRKPHPRNGLGIISWVQQSSRKPEHEHSKRSNTPRDWCAGALRVLFPYDLSLCFTELSACRGIGSCGGGLSVRAMKRLCEE